MNTAFKNFQNDKLSSSINLLKKGDWCLDDKFYTDTATPYLLSDEDITNYLKNYKYYYSYSYLQLSNKLPLSLICHGKKLDKFADNTTDMYVGAITSNELFYAGEIANRGASTFITGTFWTISLIGNPVGLGDEVMYNNTNYIASIGQPLNALTNTTKNARPVVILKSGIKITDGNGTIDNPYLIDLNS